MSKNPKFEYDLEKYIRCKDFLNRIKGKSHISNDEVKELHKLSTELGVWSRPSNCGSCNGRARTVLLNYVAKHKEYHDREREKTNN